MALLKTFIKLITEDFLAHGSTLSWSILVLSFYNIYTMKEPAVYLLQVKYYNKF